MRSFLGRLLTLQQRRANILLAIGRWGDTSVPRAWALAAVVALLTWTLPPAVGAANASFVRSGNGAAVATSQGQLPAEAEARTAAYFETVREQPLLLGAFLRAMPKGADLHNHLSGAVYAESYIQYASTDGLCVVRVTMALVPGSCDAAAGTPPAASALSDTALYSAMINAWSMRGFVPGPTTGHDHFFNTFGLFGAVSSEWTGDMLAEAVARGAAQNTLYLELMVNFDNGGAARLGTVHGWEPDLGKYRDALLAGGVSDVVTASRQSIDVAEARMREALRCGQPTADPGCSVQVRYLYQANRNREPEVVFAQLVYAFELVQADPRVRGVNIVSPEDFFVSMRDYRLHMEMFGFLHALMPSVNLSLHAGELAPGLVPPEGLRFHIREAVQRAHAQRIGHGVDVMHEDDPFGLLAEMARREILVEINLTSNQVILEISGPNAPFPVYRAAGVPVALSTDDEGVSRIDLTHEYRKATEEFGLSYPDLKALSRNSLTFSFLPGESLWGHWADARPVAPCATDAIGSDSPSDSCAVFLNGSEKALLQWQLEAAYTRFEGGY